MAQWSSFFNAIKESNGAYDREYDAGDWAEYFASFIGNGIFPNPTNNLQVQAGEGLNVIVNEGKAWINGYFYSNTEPLTLPLNPANQTYGRIDTVVCELNLNTREISIYIVEGNCSPNPIASPLVKSEKIYQLALAQIMVGANVTSIGQSSINDTRFNSGVCGVVAGVVNQIDTTDLFNQFSAAFDNLFAKMQSQITSLSTQGILNELNNIKSNYLTESSSPTLFGDWSLESGCSFTFLDNNGNNLVMLESEYASNENTFSLTNLVGNQSNPILSVTPNSTNSQSLQIETPININGIATVSSLTSSAGITATGEISGGSIVSNGTMTASSITSTGEVTGSYFNSSTGATGYQLNGTSVMYLDGNNNLWIDSPTTVVNYNDCAINLNSEQGYQLNGNNVLAPATNGSILELNSSRSGFTTVNVNSEFTINGQNVMAFQTIDLGSYTSFDQYIETGIYYSNANSTVSGMTNAPGPYAGLLEVFDAGYGNNAGMIYQRYTTYENVVYTRSYYASNLPGTKGHWSSWIMLSPSGTWAGFAAELDDVSNGVKGLKIENENLKVENKALGGQVVELSLQNAELKNQIKEIATSVINMQLEKGRN
ncbi:MAG: pyocin knob domain-containing protein [Sarcina sp.]